MHFFILLPPLAYKTISPAPPVGLAYLAAIIKDNGLQVTALTPDAVGKDIDQTVEKVIETKPDVLGISVATPAYNNSIKITRRVKSALRSIVVMVGGPHAALFPEDFLKEGVDIVIRGEGEQTIVDLIGYLEGKTNIEAIDGVSYLDNGKIIHNKDRSLIKNLDEIPFPAWEFFSIGHFESVFRSLSSFSLPIVSSRGCPGKCTFCYKGIFGNRFRVRSAENIIREIFTCKMLLISKSFLL